MPVAVTVILPPPLRASTDTLSVRSDQCLRRTPRSWVGAESGAAVRRYACRMRSHTFHAVFEDAGDGWVYAHVPELPEVQTQGETLDQAREMVRDAIEVVIADRRDRGEAIPPTAWATVESVEVAA